MLGKVLINFNLDSHEHLQDLGLDYKESNGELKVIVDDVPYEVIDGYYQDPDAQFCEHYGINYYKYVNSIEAYNFCAI